MRDNLRSLASLSTTVSKLIKKADFFKPRKFLPSEKLFLQILTIAHLSVLSILIEEHDHSILGSIRTLQSWYL